MDLEVRQHLVVVGANDVGKTSLLRLLNLALAAPLGQLYQSLSREDLRDTDRPLMVEAVLRDFSAVESGVFYREIDVDPMTRQRTLTVRLEVIPSVDDPEAVDIQRVLAGTADRRPPTREQLLALGWRYLPATRGTGAAQLDGPNSALRILLDGLDLGGEKSHLAGILLDFNAKLHTSEKLSELRSRIAQHLAKSMPKPVAGDDLAVRTAADPAASVLEGVGMYVQREDQYIPVSEQSDGLRQLMAMTLFDLAENSANIIAVDEPELHLHPASQRTVAELFVAGANQKVICTHSPYILQRFEPSDVVVITPDGTAHQIRDDKLNVIEKLRAQWWSSRLLEALTARYVIAVEGVADRIIVEAAARVLGIGLDRIGAVVFELDGADKFRHVYKLLGKEGFGVHVLGLVDVQELGIFTGAIEGKPKDIVGSQVWACQADLEEEYCTALTGPVAGGILIDAGVARAQGLLQSCGATALEELTAEAVAAYCRKNKVEAAVVIAAKLTEAMVQQMSSIRGLLAKVAELAEA
ncbi:ATP-dependent nuclease [Actinocorallia aurantiaca]|uniref:ATP-dependent nuclease n=1 Tax=Actinocorallia aurantiaca TaxID=46204 RepID=UPI0031DC50DF